MAVFTKGSLVWLPLTALYLLACSQQSIEQPEEDPFVPKDFEAPEPCELSRTDQTLCEFQGLPPTNDSMVGGMGGMGGMGGASPHGEDEDDVGEWQRRCLVDQDITLSCPSRVGMLATARGAQDELDVVVAQLGADALDTPATPIPNDQAYVHTLRLHDDEQLSVGADMLEPFPAATGNLALLPATSQFDTLLVTHQQPSEDPPGTLSILPLLGGATVMSSSVTTPFLRPPRSFVTSQAEGIFVEFAPHEGLFVTSGLPNQPFAASRTEHFRAVAVDATPSGELRVAVLEPAESSDRIAQVRLLGGAALDQELWSFEAERVGSESTLDLAHLSGMEGDTAAVLWRNRGVSEHFRVTLVDPDGTAAPRLTLGNSSSSCSSLSIGLTCDNCPVGQHCQVRKEQAHTGRIFESAGRLFVAYLVTDQAELHEYRRNTSFLGVGCTCTHSLVSVEAAADFLVVVEIDPTAEDRQHAVVERMRELVGGAGATRNSFMTRGPRGTVDVVFGPFFGRFSDGQREFPEDPIEYRVLRVSPHVAP